MTKFTEKALTNYPMAFYFTAMRSFDERTSNVETELTRFHQMQGQSHQLFVAFDSAYKNSLKNLLSDTIKKKDEERDHLAHVIERVAGLWAEKLDDETLTIHGKRVTQVFKDFDFRVREALVAENAKMENIQQRFAEETLKADLATMGLTELNARMKKLTYEIVTLMSQRNEEQSAIIVGELKAAREALDAHYRQFITYLNAVQELQPEDGISQAAQYYNEDIRKIDLQIAQSRKRKKSEDDSSDEEQQ